MKILALDPGSMLGWAIDDNNIMSYGHVELVPRTKKAQQLHPYERYKSLRDFLESKYAEHDGFDVVAYETPFTKFRKDAAVLQSYVGIIKLFLAEHDIADFRAVNPKTLKKFITGDGNAAKEKVFTKVQELTKIVLDPKAPGALDTSDAIAVLLFAVSNKWL